MNNNPEVIVIKEKRENVDKMKQELAKKEKQYTTLKNVGEALSAFGTPVLIGSLLSPVDFDGPIIEIVSGVVLIAGTIMKKVAQNELENIEAMKTDGDHKHVPVSSKIDEKDMMLIADTAGKIRTRAEQKKSQKGSTMGR